MKTIALTLILAGCVAAAGAIVAEAASASTVHSPPSAPCNSAHIMDLVITDEGVWFECVCEQLLMGIVCDWYELGPAPDAAAARRRWNYVRPSMQRQLRAPHRWPRFLSWRLAAKPTPKVITTPAGAITTGLCNDPYLADDAWAQTHGC